eukprot:TRINITY_DN2505_c0_g1_i8.p1 TRINITY_DN2505_c0_g1~~TRINITY_DN2505_c0_g1_i8.p1  ORF type:complete len:192 (+),score=63.16 TRINITY_DN2505_c0_g1_i8:25-576(+)
MIRRPPRSTHCISSAASDVYKRQVLFFAVAVFANPPRVLQDNSINDFIYGLLRGLGELGDYTQLFPCAWELEEVIGMFCEALRCLKDHHGTNLEECLHMLLEACRRLRDQLAPCAEGLEVLMTFFRNIDMIGIDILVEKFKKNQKEMLNFVNLAYNNCKETNYKDLGLYLGELLNLLFLTGVA